MPISAPSHDCLRTAPRNRKPTPIVTIARKSSRTLSAAKPTTTPAAPATAMPAAIDTGSGSPATEHSAAA